MAEESKDVNTEVEENLAAAATEESSTTETKEVTTTAEVTETEEGKDEKHIPYPRFVEVNSALKEARAAQETTVTQLAESNQKLIELTELLQAKSEDVDTLNEIKSYINDPEMAEHITAIDNKLKGIDAEVEKGKTTPEDAIAKTQKLLQTAKEEMEDARATQQAENLVTKADVIADKLLAQLPEEYNEQDRNVITDLWTEKMDWDKAVADPDNLSNLLTENFQSVIDRYGTPRGALLSKEQVEELKPEASTEKTPEQELDEAMNKDWGAVKERDAKPGLKPTFEAVESDADFDGVLAKIIRTTHGR